ncbi:MAG: hypothetical protein NDI61_08000 [Bdellovibrionaceae bacterium]|nr:hypothetical protein [Pseudobdellovibrionaceae bacterium]
MRLETWFWKSDSGIKCRRGMKFALKAVGVFFLLGGCLEGKAQKDSTFFFIWIAAAAGSYLLGMYVEPSASDRARPGHGGWMFAGAVFGFFLSLGFVKIIATIMTVLR